MLKNNPLHKDLDLILEKTCELWSELSGKRIFIAGGTGFFGCWLLETFLWVNGKLNLGAQATVLSRNPDAFTKKASHLAQNAAVDLIRGDIRSFEYPPGEFHLMIHAASDSVGPIDPLPVLDTHIVGTKRLLELAAISKTKKFLLISSGAVYGRHVPSETIIDENCPSFVDVFNPTAPYDEGKRVSELLCGIYASQHGFEAKIARCFSAFGPYQPLDAHFAIGNFILDRINNRPINVKGDGTAQRSYLYAADLMIWIWTLLFKGANMRPFNVGGEIAYSMSQLAEMVGSLESPTLPIQIANSPDSQKHPNIYAPCVKRAKIELGVTENFGLRDGITRTLEWTRSSK